MKHLFTFLFLFILSLPLFSQRTVTGEPDDFEFYMMQNNQEKRLAEYKDSDEELKIKLFQLDVINDSRKRYRADPVNLDILASRVANMMSREAAENDFTGHWNMAGEKPYHRYAFAGGYNHVSENAYGEWSSAGYDRSAQEINDKMKAGHSSFMAERAPNDGHKQNIIDKDHNFVGIGFYLNGNHFRYYEEFIDRYFDYEHIPEQVKTGEDFTITFKPAGDYYPYFIIAYYEKFPAAMKPAQLRKKGSYPDYTGETYLQMAAWDIARYKNGASYTVPMKFSKEGLYYIQIYYDKKEITKPGSLNTKGKSPASGIVIKAYK
jgi:uncharacterized protein YkwD